MTELASQTLLRTDFFDRARARLTLDPPAGLTDPDALPVRGDHDADPVVKAIAAVRPIKPAAVLIPVIDRDEPMVLLTERATRMSTHSGQIAFPGGKRDPQDATLVDTALQGLDDAFPLSDTRKRTLAAIERSFAQPGQLPATATVLDVLSIHEKEKLFGLFVNGDLALKDGQPGDYATFVELAGGRRACLCLRRCHPHGRRCRGRAHRNRRIRRRYERHGCQRLRRGSAPRQALPARRLLI